MGVPTGFSLAVISLHRLEARIEVFHRARKAVAGVRDSVGGGGAFVEDKRAFV